MDKERKFANCEASTELTDGKLGDGATDPLGDYGDLPQLGLLASPFIAQDLVLQPAVALRRRWDGIAKCTAGCSREDRAELKQNWHMTRKFKAVLDLCGLRGNCASHGLMLILMVRTAIF